MRDSYEISPETKRLVMEYAERLNYRPNPIALSLKGSSSKAIAVIVPQIANNFFLAGHQRHRGHRLQPRLPRHHFPDPRERTSAKIANVQQAVSRRVDGLLLSLSSETSDVVTPQSTGRAGNAAGIV